MNLLEIAYFMNEARVLMEFRMDLGRDLLDSKGTIA